MFPLRDTVRSRTLPLVNLGLIGLNVVVFLYELSLGAAGLDRLFGTYALIPARLSLAQPLTFLSLITSAFLHGGWFHLLSNMWTLFIFGDNIEDRMGHSRYLVFYILGGVAAALAQTVFDPSSRLPTVGASGAIAAVLGAYFLLFPQGRVLTFLPLFFLPWFVEIPAFIFLGIWFLSQLSSGLFNLGAAGTPGSYGGIAWWAHVGGFVFGLILVNVFARRRRRPTVWPSDLIGPPRIE
jgi:membrane associated rhomboid family serine protease